MISGKLLADQLEKFLKSPVCQSARVQVKLPQGEFRSPDGYFDIIGISLLENHIELYWKYLQQRVGVWVKLKRRYNVEN